MSTRRSAVRTRTTAGGRLRAALMCLALLVPGVAVMVDNVRTADDAGAAVNNVFPADADGFPNGTFRADDALFVILTSDLQGGTVCVVDATVTVAASASCQGPAWGSPNFIVGIGTIHSLIEAPLLPVGQWRLLGATPNGAVGTTLSETFTVLPCAGACDTGPADAIVAQWKARAGGTRDAAGVACRGAEVKGLASAASAARGMYALAGGGLAAMALGGVAGVANYFIPSSSEDLALAIFKDLSCGVRRMMADIAADPPDFNYGTVAPPVFRGAPASGIAAFDDLLDAYEAADAYGVASRIAFERYQGAMIDEEYAAAAMQAEATAEYTRWLVRELRAIELLTPAVAGLPEMAGPLTTAEDLAEAVALRQRIAEDGHTPEEIAQLEALGFSAAAIAEIEADLAEDISGIDPGTALSTLLAAVATEAGQAVGPFDTFGRQLSVAAAELEQAVPDNQAPVASFTASATSGTAPLTVTFTSTSFDPDGDDLELTWDIAGVAHPTGPQATHTFETPGTHWVSLVASDGELWDQAIQAIEVAPPGTGEPENQPPVASFEASVTEGEAPLEVTFTSTSTDPDGDDLTLTWDFGDGSSGSGAVVSRTYTGAGTYTVTLVASDGALASIATETVVVSGAPPALAAGFTVAKGYDPAKAINGASIVSATSEFNATSTAASNILAGGTSSWQSATGEDAGQDIVLALGGGGLDLVDRVVLTGMTGTLGVRDVEVALSAGGLGDGDFTTVATLELPNSVTPEEASFTAQRARYVRVRALTNYGGARMQMREVSLPTPDREGGIVSLPEGPPGAVAAVSSQASASFTAEMAIDRSPTSRWQTATGATIGEWLRLELGGEGTHLVNRVLLRGNNHARDINQFEVLVSTTGEEGSFVSVLTDAAEQSNQPQPFVFPATEARFVELRVISNHGATMVGLADFHVVTSHGLNVADGVGVGAAVASVSSENQAAVGALQHGTAQRWLTPTGQSTDQHLTVLLRNGDVHVVDRVMVRSHSSRPRNVQILASSTGQAPADFSVVASAELANVTDDSWLVFPPVEARYVQLRVLDSWATTIGVNELRVFAATRGGGSDVPFVDLSQPVGPPITSWAWDFGDGASSTAQHPVHSFPGPGTYQVSLTVTDADGGTSTRTQPYTVPAVPTLSVAPTNTSGSTTVNERQTVALRGESDGEGGAILQWAWDLGYPLTTGSNVTQNAQFPDQGSYDVVASGLSADWLWTSSPPLTFEVLNVAPTVNTGADQTVYATDPVTPVSTVSDPADVPSCVWDWGDGTTSDPIDPCTGTASRVPHAYALPGVYTATLTADDGDGGITSDSMQVTVLQRASFLQIIEAEPDGDDLRVVARLHDGVEAARLPGMEVTVVAGNPGTATATTDTDGEVDVLLTGAAGAEEVTVTFEGTVVFEPSSLTRAVVAPFADIVFMIDESGSMGGHQAAVRQRVREISQGLAPHLDYRLGLVGYGGHVAGDRAHIHTGLTQDLTHLSDELADLRVNGGRENGFEATVLAMSDGMGFRPHAAVCAVLITDEPATPNIHPTNGPETFEDAVAALNARSAPFFGIIANNAQSNADYGVPDGLAGVTGGEIWFINTFTSDASAVLDALVESCVTAALVPDLALAKESDQDVAGPGEEVTYTLTVTNTAAVAVTGVTLTDTLPEHVTFVSASDGGTPDETTGDVTWPAFDVGIGGEVERTVTVLTAPAVALGPGAHEVVNHATVADDGSQGPERDPTDNDASAPVTILVGDGPHPIGLTLSPPNVELEVGEQHCVAAHVVDLGGGPAVGVTVEFSVEGANPGSGQSGTGADGHAEHCYTSEAAGDDEITATAAGLTATATATWALPETEEEEEQGDEEDIDEEIDEQLDEEDSPDVPPPAIPTTAPPAVTTTVPTAVQSALQENVADDETTTVAGETHQALPLTGAALLPAAALSLVLLAAGTALLGRPRSRRP